MISGCRANIPSHPELLDSTLSRGGSIAAIMSSIYMSGHGTQIPDDNGDEDDGLDEAFLPVDASRRRPAPSAST